VSGTNIRVVVGGCSSGDRTDILREYVLVIHHVLHPCQQEIDIFWGTACDWLLYLDVIRPFVLVSAEREISISCTSGTYRRIWATYFGPAFMMGQLSFVHLERMVSYSILIWLKKSMTAPLNNRKSHQNESK
jgi:hypothetical protein